MIGCVPFAGARKCQPHGVRTARRHTATISPNIADRGAIEKDLLPRSQFSSLRFAPAGGCQEEAPPDSRQRARNEKRGQAANGFGGQRAQLEAQRRRARSARKKSVL
jgi:hypothetical protein